MKEMRRKVQKLTQEEIVAILERNTSGILSLLSEDGYPYGVPLSYLYEDNTILFHCARVGHKIDAIKHNDKACFSVIDQDDVIAEQNTTHYKSAIVFGKMRIVEDADGIRKYMNKIANKYSPHQVEYNESKINKEFPRICILIMEIDYMSGKQAKGLMQKG